MEYKEIKIIGRESCTLCNQVKESLKGLYIDYESYDMDDLNPIEKFNYMSYAKKARQLSLPIILVDGKFIKTTEFIAQLKGDI